MPLKAVTTKKVILMNHMSNKYANNPYLFLAFKGGKWLNNSAPWKSRNLHHSWKQIPGNKHNIWNINKIARRHKMVNTKIIYKIKQQTGNFIVSQIMYILNIVNKGLGRMKKSFVPALISQQNFALLIRNISKTPISLNKQFRASANYYDQHYNVD